jgi:tetratricopeptide (TPR) repeat protein
MASPEERILKHLTEDAALANISADKLTQLTEQYPYYGAASFLLAKKLFIADDAGKEKALYKAALHFSNGLWLNFNLIAGSPANVKSEASRKQWKEIVQNENPVAADSDEPFYDEEDDKPVEEIVEDPVLSERLNMLLQQQASEFEKPVDAAAEISMETVPHHRIDYFESQGIRLEEDKPTDKLGKQLRKFTDWLKQMKTINPNTVQLKPDDTGEREVQHIAEHSNEPEEIITETMAEVLEKQGKPEQAIEIYEKLSFNNPSKSAYFAAKIEKLKVRQ